MGQEPLPASPDLDYFSNVFARKDRHTMLHDYNANGLCDPDGDLEIEGLDEGMEENSGEVMKSIRVKHFDDDPVVETGTNSGESLELTPVPSPSPAESRDVMTAHPIIIEPIQIIITFCRDSYTFDITQSMCLFDLMLEIELRLGCLPQHQKLIFRGRILKDVEAKLTDLGVESMSRMLLVCCDVERLKAYEASLGIEENKVSEETSGKSVHNSAKNQLVLYNGMQNGATLTPNSPESPPPSPPSQRIDIVKQYSNNNEKPSVGTSGFRTRLVKPGVTGLYNLGNTCYMNSALQCLSNSQELTRYFLDEVFRREVNKENPLGTGGRLADSYWNLLNNLWRAPQDVFRPIQFKNVIGHYFSAFDGYQQHDAQELLAVLLDGLHEDLNRIKKKPCFEVPEWTGELPDAQVSEESWRLYRSRNDSVIVDLFQGQYKSTLVCLVCGKVSVTFDPCMYLSLPVPATHNMTIGAVYVPYDPARRPVKLHVRLPNDAQIRDLEGKVSEKFEVSGKKLLTVEIFQNKIFRWYHKDDNITQIVPDSDEIYIYELPFNIPENWDGSPPKNSEGGGVIFPVVHRARPKSPYSRHAISELEYFGVPLMVALPWSAVHDPRKLQKEITRQYQRYTTFDLSGVRQSLFRMRVVKRGFIPGGTCRVHWGGSDEEEIMARFNVLKSMREQAQCDKKEGEEGEEKKEPKKESDGEDMSEGEGDIGGSLGGESGIAQSQVSNVSLYEYPTTNPHRVQSWMPQHYQHLLNTARWVRNGTLVQNGEFVVCEWPSEFVDAFFRTPGYDDAHLAAALAGDRTLEQTSDVSGMGAKAGHEDEQENIGQALWEVFDSSVANGSPGKKTGRRRDVLTLQDCFDDFTHEEHLSDMDAWYCPRCKRHQPATKTVGLWRLPQHLIVHLKRFAQHRWRDKITERVEYPLEGLRLDPWMVPGSRLKNKGAEYDLYGVVNHRGSLNGGHYTAYAFNCQLKKWYYFNDSHYSQIEPSDFDVESAYLLFYRRRDTEAADEEFNGGTINSEVQLNGVNPSTSKTPNHVASHLDNKDENMQMSVFLEDDSAEHEDEEKERILGMSICEKDDGDEEGGEGTAILPSSCSDSFYSIGEDRRDYPEGENADEKREIDCIEREFAEREGMQSHSALNMMSSGLVSMGTVLVSPVSYIRERIRYLQEDEDDEGEMGQASGAEEVD
ncbi:uncharacterized protein VTP21DRAFT_1521 [Calcarisporiella thermophila]|uniref:uncharacterized protein n=1 Tax=Calcarisporiella thermophila TaxID=911321 RepID=UPI003742C598